MGSLEIQTVLLGLVTEIENRRSARIKNEDQKEKEGNIDEQ